MCSIIYWACFTGISICKVGGILQLIKQLTKFGTFLWMQIHHSKNSPSTYTFILLVPKVPHFSIHLLLKPQAIDIVLQWLDLIMLYKNNNFKRWRYSLTLRRPIFLLCSVIQALLLGLSSIVFFWKAANCSLARDNGNHTFSSLFRTWFWISIRIGASSCLWRIFPS